MQKSICSVLKSLADIFVSETNILQKNPSPQIFLDCRETQSIFEEPETVESFVLLIENNFFHNLELVLRIYKIHFVAKSNFAEQKLLMLIFKKCKRRREGCEKFLKRYCV